MTTQNRKKIILIIGYVFATLTLGIIAYRLNLRKVLPVLPEYYQTQDPNSVTEEFTGKINFKLNTQLALPEILPVYETPYIPDLDITTKLNLSLTTELPGYKRWENSEWMYIEEDETGDYKIRSKKYSAGTLTNEYSEYEIRTIATEFITNTLGIDIETSDLNVSIDEKYNSYIVNFSRKINGYNVIEYTTPVTLFSIEISPERDVYFASINHPKLLSAIEANTIPILSTENITNLTASDLSKYADVYYILDGEPTSEDEHLHPISISDDLTSTTITDVNLSYQVKTSTEDNLILPVLVMTGSVTSKEGHSGEVTIIYPATAR